jgi:aldehyde dehydrogenase (NAD+)
MAADPRTGTFTFPDLYVDGAWRSPSDGTMLPVTDAGTGAEMARVAAGSAADVDIAVKAAGAAFAAWSALAPAERAGWLERIADAIEARSDEFSALMAREVGMPYAVAVGNQTNLALTDLRTAAASVRDFAWDETIGNVRVTREPIGVVGAITPWNYPLHQICAKVGAALAAGCTVVLKPSEVAPLSALLLADVADRLGLPAGVLNVVNGTGPTVGEALATHPDVDMVSFTGSTRAGTRVMSLAAETVKKVALELGGKSANILLDDADLETAVVRGVDDVMRNSGQNCTALTRMLVPRPLLPRVEELARERAGTYRAGDLFDPATTLGSLASAAQLDRVRGYIERGLADGATLLCGGTEPPDDVHGGYFVRPTVFTAVTNDMTIAREEIFGPVLCILGYDTEDEAVAIANDSPYGLSGAVWSADPERAERVAGRLRTGRVSLNGAPYHPFAPFGGYKRSGLGRELGRFGLKEFLEVKSIMR